MSTISLPPKVKDKTYKIGIGGRIKLLFFKLGYGHIGGLAAVGAYFFITQLLHGQHTTIGSTLITFPDVKGVWDHLLDATAANGGLLNIMPHGDWNTIRHLIRPLYEGIFGGLLFALVSYNPFKVKLKENPPLLSRIAIATRIIPTIYRPVTAIQIILLPLTITLFSIPGVAAGYGIDEALKAIFKVHSFAPALGSHPDVVQKFYSGSFDAKIIGIFASLFFAGRVAKPVFNFVLRYFAQRRALAGKKARFLHPPAFKNLVQFYTDAPRAELVRKQDRHGAIIRTVVPASAVLVAAFAGLGYYVLRFIAG